jgi:hypothetical protein
MLMYLDLNKSVPELPSVRLFADHVIADLRDNRSVIVFLPYGVDAEWILQRIRKELFNLGVVYSEIPVVQNSDYKGCAPYIGNALGIIDENGYSPETPQGLLNIPDLPTSLLLVTNDSLNLHAAKKWLSFLKEWVRLNHKRANSGGRQTPILLVLSDSAIPRDLPNSDVYLSFRFWWGFPSLLETRLLCRHSSPEIDKHSSSSLWPEFVCSAVAGGDLNLLAHLWNDYETNKSLEDQILRYSQGLNWKEDQLNQIKSLLNSQFRNGNSSLEYPPKLLIESWAKGIVTHIPERGICFHTAALVLMRLWDDTYHRIWTGQAEFLMPKIDSFRLQICDYLTERFGKSWPTSWVSPLAEDEIVAVKENPRACQWGHLSKIFDVAPKLRRLSNLYKAVKFVRVIRNELAHFRPIKNRDFRRLSELFAKCEF